ncbi:MAG: ABC transporter ATP-binding protein [Clostridia bacterium]|nr:ABC transporter ATP-binding protein [Clostridia bacterium]
MKRIFKYLSKYKIESVLAPLFKMLEATFELLVPLVIKKLIDVGIVQGDRMYILSMCGLLVLFCAIGYISAVTAQYFSAKAAVGVAEDLRHDLYAKVQKFTYRDLDRIGVSNIITRLIGDVGQVQTGINMTLRLLLRSPFIVFGAMIMAFTIDVKCALVFAVAIPLLLAVVFTIMLVTIPLFVKVQENLERILRVIRQNLTGVRVIRAFGIEQKESAAFDRENDAHFRLSRFVSRISVLLSPLTYLIINIAIVVLIYTGAIRMEYGLLTQGALIALYDYMSQILIELIKFANFVILLTKSAASAARIDEFFALGEPLARTSAPDIETDAHLIFDRVSFGYTAGTKVLSDISFSAKRGQTIGVIGGTGSGKTSLVNLIPRFYDADVGGIYLDGKNVRTLDAVSLRHRIGVVPQKAELFSGSIRENLAFGNPDATEEEMLAAVHTAQGDDILCEKEGLDTYLAEGGKNLSGGQRQRLTIARALVADPEILILDDSASALDYATDARLRAAIAERKDPPTTLIVSQRTAAVMHADLILVLDRGCLVGKGKHDDLMKSCEVYREIYESQFKEADAE